VCAIVVNPGDHEVLIGIDNEVLAGLKKLAEPLIDDPNTVMRRLLRIDTDEPGGKPPRARIRADIGVREVTLSRPASSSQTKTRSKGPSPAQKPPRAPKGSLTREDEFEQPILRALEQASGQLPVREVIGQVGEAMDDILNAEDRIEDHRGNARWEKRAHFVRLKMVERGLLRRDAPRGTWELSELGRRQISGARLTAGKS
jgi:hypothetical protein